MVKRYDDVWKYTGNGGSLKFNGPVILATDYDALEARVRELEGLLSRVNNYRGADFKRITELEAALHRIREILREGDARGALHQIGWALGSEKETP